MPFTALRPTVIVDGPAPLVLAWHMLDPPCTDAAFAAALPLSGVPAWRVHLGMPLCGARMIENSMDAVDGLARKDPLMAYLAPFVWQAAEEVPGRAVSVAPAAAGRHRTTWSARRFPRGDGRPADLGPIPDSDRRRCVG